MFDEVIHARLARAGHSQRQEDGHVADDDEDQQDPQEGQLFGLQHIIYIKELYYMYYIGIYIVILLFCCPPLPLVLYISK